MYRNTLSARMLHAVRSGEANTARDLAALFDHPRGSVSAMLCRLADLGLIVRGPTVPTRRGRPCIRYEAALR